MQHNLRKVWNGCSSRCEKKNIEKHEPLGSSTRDLSPKSHKMTLSICQMNIFDFCWSLSGWSMTMITTWMLYFINTMMCNIFFSFSWLSPCCSLCFLRVGICWMNVHFTLGFVKPTNDHDHKVDVLLRDTIEAVMHVVFFSISWFMPCLILHVPFASLQ